MGGGISLESEENKGSTFSVELPLEISQKAMPIAPKIEINPKSELSLLIIDDDPSMLKLLKEVCITLNINAHTYNNFNNIGKKDEIGYDMVLTDIQMPNFSGFDVLSNLRNNGYSHYYGQPIVAMTGRKDIEKELYMKAGFSDILQKPFTKEMLLDVLVALFPNTRYEDPTDETERIPATTTDSSLFNLQLITSFLGNDQEGIAQILETFINDTSSNMKQLGTAIEATEIEKINTIAHRMLPMFRQLDAKDIIPLLEELELVKNKELSAKVLKQNYLQIKNKTTALVLAIKSHLLTSPNYSD